MNQTPVRIDSMGLLLEGVFYAPDGAPPASVVVVCHPHPQRGGEMRNNVVMAIVRALTSSAIGALTFNFRGVGASQGSHDNGAGERDDVRAALAHARSLPGVERVGLAGYSFGAGMAAAVVDDQAAALALVGAPPAVAQSEALAVYHGPVLMVSGDADHVSAAEKLREAAARVPGGAEVVIVPGVDHFWWGRETALEDILSPFFRAHLLSSVSPAAGQA